MKYRILMTAALTVFTFAAAAADQVEATPNSTFPLPAKATRDDWRPHVGVMGGIAAPEGSFDSTVEFGFDIGYQPYIPYGLGMEVTYFKAEGNNEQLERTQALIKGTYNFGGENDFVKYSYVGAGIGAHIRNSETRAVLAPLAGFDIPIQRTEDNAEFVSLGAAVKYAFVDNEADNFSISGEMKFWY